MRSNEWRITACPDAFSKRKMKAAPQAAHEPARLADDSKRPLASRGTCASCERFRTSARQWRVSGWQIPERRITRFGHGRFISYKGGEVTLASPGSFLPPMSVPVRRWRWRRRWRRRRRLEVPSVMVVVMVDASASHWRSGCSALASLGYPLAPYGSLGPHCVRRVRHCDSGNRDYGEHRDEFDLVHGVVPFFAWGYVFLLRCGPYESANQPSDERRSDFAPVLRVERAAVMVVVVMLRLMVMSGRRRIVMCDLMPRLMLCRRGVIRIAVRVCFRRLMRGCLRDLFCRSGLCCLRRLCLHRRRRFPAFRRIAFRSRHCRAAKCAADRESQHHLLYCLVHRRVPFVVSRKPILALTHR